MFASVGERRFSYEVFIDSVVFFGSIVRVFESGNIVTILGRYLRVLHKKSYGFKEYLSK